MLATAHQQSRMEREESEVRVVPYLTEELCGILPLPSPDADCSRGDWRVCPPQ